MSKFTIEQEEALQSLISHYGLPIFMLVVDQVIENIGKGILSSVVDVKDPEKTAMLMYAERMKYEGAKAVKEAMQHHINKYKGEFNERRFKKN